MNRKMNIPRTIMRQEPLAAVPVLARAVEPDALDGDLEPHVAIDLHVVREPPYPVLPAGELPEFPRFVLPVVQRGAQAWVCKIKKHDVTEVPRLERALDHELELQREVEKCGRHLTRAVKRVGQ
ncbi:hypothetical protein GSI_12690 [Ganoderma sinense ZZ0214-1]|uniref:Uncharacterized protein n=1 Tax=Ganoderma sinense ZZ0214-1 TaxID=1077348 RepID=A0A2G8RTJ6_9APHY|nr:hypothetical protein GSI_12690 [Ganoderma sinense ZZ0214-1]